MGLFDFLTNMADEAIEVVPTISEEKVEEALGHLENMDTEGLGERLESGDINEEFFDDLIDTLEAFDDAITVIMCGDE